MTFDRIYIDHVNDAQEAMKELHEKVKKQIEELVDYQIRIENYPYAFMGEEQERVEAELEDYEEFSSLVDEIIHKLKWLKEDWL